MAQDYKSVPKLIFRINDNVSINNIIRNHNINNIDKDALKEIYLDATEIPLNFLTLDFKTNDERYKIRRNFNEII